MVKPEARILWKLVNYSKHKCCTCKFRSYNKAHYDRHMQSTKHFLLVTFAEECPNDLKIIVASFLHIRQIFILGENGVHALNLVWPRLYRWSRHQMEALHHASRIVGLPSQNVVFSVMRAHM